MPREDAPALTRNDARRAWKTRSLLTPTAMDAFDHQDVATRRQISTLYHEILVWERAPRDEIAGIVPSADGVGIVRRSESGAD